MSHRVDRGLTPVAQSDRRISFNLHLPDGVTPRLLCFWGCYTACVFVTPHVCYYAAVVDGVVKLPLWGVLGAGHLIGRWFT